MGDPASFDLLVQELTSDNRKQLLERIRRSAPVSDAPLADPGALGQAQQFDLGEEYAKLSWLQRTLLGLRATFSGIERDDLLAQDIAQRLGALLRRSHPDLIDVRRKLLSSRAATELRRLAAVLSPLRSAFNDGLVLRRDEFVAYLVASLLPALHRQLLAATDPALATPSDLADLKTLRREMNARFENTVAEIGDADRQRLYREVGSLHQLNGLVQHDIDGIANLFPPQGAAFAPVRLNIVALANRLAAATEPPSADAVAALFLFHYGAAASTQPPPAGEITAAGTEHVEQTRLAAQLERSNSAFAAIRVFNTRFPATSVVRMVTGNVNWLPEEPGGGEDWYALLRSYWRRRLSAVLDAYSRAGALQQLTSDARQLLGSELSAMGSYDRISGSPARTRHVTSIGLLLGITQAERFRSVLRPLRILLTSGEFYRSDNRVEFEGSLAGLEALPRELAQLDAEFAAAATAAPGTTSVGEADQSVRRLVDTSVRHCTELTALVGGILDGKVGGKYDSITNLTTIGGRENRRLLADFGASRTFLEQAAAYLRQAVAGELENDA